MLVTTHELSQHLHDRDWIVFDCRHELADPSRGACAYSEGHVPGAFFAAVDTDLAGEKTGTNGRHPLPRPEAFAAFLGQHGVTSRHQVVAYDDVGGQYAARLWWLARWIGHARVAVLDGGLPKWIADGFALTTDVPEAQREGLVASRPDSRMVATADDVLTAITSGGCLVIDARAPERFRGELETIDPVAGHIPTARNRFFKTNLAPDLTLRDRNSLRAEFTSLIGPWLPEQVIHQCGSGITACANLLAMEHSGLAGARLYVGSWSEWSADPARPIARGA
jgi:thiosulfate/3-mercaptopyruvate sulfurtransferase